MVPAAAAAQHLTKAFSEGTAAALQHSYKHHTHLLLVDRGLDHQLLLYIGPNKHFSAADSSSYPGQHAQNSIL